MKTRRSSRPKRGSLVIIGGGEDRSNEMRILKAVAQRAGRGPLVVATVASLTAAADLWNVYRRVFRSLGVATVRHLEIEGREQSALEEHRKVLRGATAVFFTGGDQLRITSHLGGTELMKAIREIYRRGGLIAGTSAGASAMSSTMLLSGPSSESYRVGTRLGMAPGLGFVPNVVIDQHFAERGRIGRLLGAIALNPSDLGLGIDENTAIVMDDDKRFTVLGSGAVYVVDAHEATDSNVSDGSSDCALSLFNVRLHVLSDGDGFDLSRRVPSKAAPEERSAA